MRLGPAYPPGGVATESVWYRMPNFCLKKWLEGMGKGGFSEKIYIDMVGRHRDRKPNPPPREDVPAVGSHPKAQGTPRGG